jgi:hypothetical protein
MITRRRLLASFAPALALLGLGIKVKPEPEVLTVAKLREIKDWLTLDSKIAPYDRRPAIREAIREWGFFESDWCGDHKLDEGAKP